MDAHFSLCNLSVKLSTKKYLLQVLLQHLHWTSFFFLLFLRGGKNCLLRILDWFLFWRLFFCILFFTLPLPSYELEHSQYWSSRFSIHFWKRLFDFRPSSPCCPVVGMGFPVCECESMHTRLYSVRVECLSASLCVCDDACTSACLVCRCVYSGTWNVCGWQWSQHSSHGTSLCSDSCFDYSYVQERRLPFCPFFAPLSLFQEVMMLYIVCSVFTFYGLFLKTSQ